MHFKNNFLMAVTIACMVIMINHIYLFHSQGDTAVLQCPNGVATGFAKWTCQYGRPQATWSKTGFFGNEMQEIEGPNLAQCVSIWMSDLDDGLRSGRISVINASQTLADMTSGHQIDGGASSFLYGGDILLATRMLKHMSERMHYEIQVENYTIIQ